MAELLPLVHVSRRWVAVVLLVLLVVVVLAVVLLIIALVWELLQPWACCQDWRSGASESPQHRATTTTSC